MRNLLITVILAIFDKSEIRYGPLNLLFFSNTRKNPTTGLG